MKSKEWPIKTETDRKAMYYILNYWIDYLDFEPDDAIDTIWNDWPYLPILYTTYDGEKPNEENRYIINIDVDLKMKISRAALTDTFTGNIYIHDEPWAGDRDMIEDLKLLSFDAWYCWALDALRYAIDECNDI